MLHWFFLFLGMLVLLNWCALLQGDAPAGAPKGMETDEYLRSPSMQFELNVGFPDKHADTA